jgi:outer membrane protein TolC
MTGAQRLFVLSLAGVVLGAAPMLARQAEVLRLADAVHEAIARSAATIDARDAVTLSEAGLRLSQSQVSPQFTLDALGSFGQSNLANQNYGARFSQQFVTGTQVHANLGAMSSQNQLGTYYASNTALAVTQPLLRGFGGEAVRRDLALAEFRTEDSRRQQVLAEHQAALSMAAAYYRIVTQTRLVDVADQSLARARALLEAAEAELALGKVSKLDVLRAHQLVVQGELQALDARTAVENAKDDVRLLLRRDAAFDFTVESAIPAQAAVPPLEQLLAVAAGRRLEIEAASSAVREATMRLASTADAGRPQVDVTLQMTRNRVADSLRTAFGLDTFQFATFAGISVPLDRTPARTANQSAAIQLARANRDLETTQLRVAQEVRIAYREQARLTRTLEQADAAVGFAEQEVELATLRYQRGLSNNLDVVTAEATLLNARALRFSVTADVAVAELRLKAAAGIFDPAAEFRGDQP